MKRTAGLTFRPYPAPVNQPVIGSQSIDALMGGSQFVLESQAQLQYIRQPVQPSYPHQSSNASQTVSTVARAVAAGQSTHSSQSIGIVDEGISGRTP